MKTPEKIELDYNKFIENIGNTVSADREKIKADLNALKDKAAKFNISS